MEVLLSFFIVAALSVTFVDGAGYLQVRPPTLGQCYYEDINTAHFSYNRTFCEGPAYWCQIHICWITCGSNKRQSPINIDTRKTQFRLLPMPKFYNLHKRVPATIKNNGHAPEFNVVQTKNNKDRIILSNVPGRPKDKKYVFAQLHVHFGRDETQGSEHCIDNIFKPMEAHLVFYDLDYGNIGDARSKKDGLVGLGVMVEVRGKPQKPTVCKNGRKCKPRFAKRFSDLMEKYYEQVRCFPLEQYRDYINNDRFGFLGEEYCGGTLSQNYIQNRCKKDPDDNSLKVQVTEGLSPKDVLPYDTDLFYTYGGSLTTPPCYETVQWIVYRCPITVSSQAFNMLQFVEDSQKDELIKLGVRRPIQKNRKVTVYSSF
ncbi:Nacrein-like protein [Mytilus edulis]|uniref:Nacrein-like protein n=1 Tax=Mytilus edulis TaxID=6550 RepID=A0A8S3SUX3_MYTED|nr:Nacrein-like protein [Mytilus edulis]